ncbi:VC0807 family protein [Mycobacterium sp. GA-1841]|uniref:VC0807 family protein n=1 Tax=Mycobacterium sp. GA-1841 TaxID=1834154 RepID=UPI00273878A6|nr:VC0807 family protein [Mycobacterium sp. GA-1841]
MVIGFAAYYGARYCGQNPLEALLISTVASTLRVGYSAWRTRAFDPIAGFLMAANGITLIVGLLSQSPVITMLGQHIPGVVFQVFLMVGLARNRPVTEALLAWLRPDWVEQQIAKHRWTAAEIEGYHRKQMRLTLVVAAAGLIHLIAAAAVIFTLPVDVAAGMLGVLALTTDAIILTVVIAGVGRLLGKHRIGDFNLRRPAPLRPRRWTRSSRKGAG